MAERGGRFDYKTVLSQDIASIKRMGSYMPVSVS
jgi:hypothetical protein